MIKVVVKDISLMNRRAKPPNIAIWYAVALSIAATTKAESFFSVSDVDASDSLRSVAVGDLDGDGNQDLVAASVTNSALVLLFGDGTGRFDRRTDLLNPFGPVAVEVVDLDGNGTLDIVSANVRSSDVSVWLGDGLGSFDAPGLPLSTDSTTQGIATGDFNGDGTPDILAAAGDLLIFFGQGQGAFGAATKVDEDPFSLGSFQDVAIADLDADGDLDIIGFAFRDPVHVFLGNGAGEFESGDSVSINNVISGAAADISGDGRTDLIVISDNSFRGGRDVHTLTGLGDGTFGNRVSFDSGERATSIVVVDVDGDEHSDMVVTNQLSGNVAVFHGRGAGEFEEAVSIEVGVSPRDVATGDVNGDGMLDLVVAKFRDGRLDDIAVLTQVDRVVAQPVAAVLPASRSVAVGGQATAFATVINVLPQPVTDCRVALSAPLPVDFFFQTTNPLTNELTGSADRPVDLDGFGLQTFLVGISPREEISPTDVEFLFACGGAPNADVVPGVNTLLLSASPTPVPDVIALARTPTADGIVDLPEPPGSNAFAVATSNVGAPSTITVAATSTRENLALNLQVCETDPSDGRCLADARASIETFVDSGATPTFSVFVTGTNRVPFDPRKNRVTVTFSEGSIVRGATSVAVRTQ